MKQCVICKKTKNTTWRRVRLRATKYNPTIKRRQNINLQWVYVPADTKEKRYKKFAGKRILACAKCIKALAKIKLK